MSNDATQPVKRGRGRPRKDANVTPEARPRNRVPLTGRRTRMELNPDELDPDFKYKFVNDQTGLLDKYLSAGFVHVKQSEGITVGQRSVDTAAAPDSNVSLDVGGGVIAYLLKQPKEFADEDRAIRDKLLNEQDEALYRELNSEKEGSYGSVEFSRKQ